MTATSEEMKKYWVVELEYMTKATMVIEGNEESDVHKYIQENATGVEQLRIINIQPADEEMSAEARAWAELQKEHTSRLN